jgi:hypothetical protein
MTTCTRRLTTVYSHGQRIEQAKVRYNLNLFQSPPGLCFSRVGTLAFTCAEREVHWRLRVWLNADARQLFLLAKPSSAAVARSHKSKETAALAAVSQHVNRDYATRHSIRPGASERRLVLPSSRQQSRDHWFPWQNATVTAFTVAHSITLAGATLGFVNVRSAPVEATIALSIVFLASELLRDPAQRSDITQCYPWLVAFSFGLLHGLGFAGALAEVDLPHGEIPLALFSFNIGVECGQLAFIATALSVIFLGRIALRHTPIWAPHVAAYGIGCTASYWVFERLAASYVETIGTDCRG